MMLPAPGVQRVSRLKFGERVRVRVGVGVGEEMGVRGRVREWNGTYTNP